MRLVVSKAVLKEMKLVEQWVRQMVDLMAELLVDLMAKLLAELMAVLTVGWLEYQMVVLMAEM